MKIRHVVQCSLCGVLLFRYPTMGIDTYQRCPGCNKFLELQSIKRRVKYIRTEMYYSTSIWWKPFTWFTGEWKPTEL